MVTTVEDVDSILTRVTANESICTITQQDGVGFKVMKTTFVPSEGLFIGLDKPEGSEFQQGETLGVTFRAGHKKCMFNGSIKQVGDTLQMTRPDTVYAVKRRLYHRAVVPYPVNTYLNVGSTCYHCRVSDISVGGVLLVTQEKVTDVEPGEQAQISIIFNKRQSLNAVDGLVRGVEYHNDEYYISLQFVGLEFSTEHIRHLKTLADRVQDVSRHIRHRSRRPVNVEKDNEEVGSCIRSRSYVGTSDGGENNVETSGD